MKVKYEKDSGRSSKVTPSCKCVVFVDKSALKKLFSRVQRVSRCTTCTFKHHHSSPVKMHMTVLRDEQRRHYCAVVAPVRYILSCSVKHCLTNG